MMSKIEVSLMARESILDEHVKRCGHNLCHYTSIITLTSILEKREFWLGSTANMNDKSEIRHFIGELRESLYKFNENEHYIRIFGQLDKLIKNEKSFPYAIAFSKLIDNAAQWERYANNAMGCCLVINTRKFLSTLQSNFRGTFFGNVFYDYNILKHPFYGILMYYFEAGKFDGSPKLGQFTNENDLIHNIYSCAVMRKHNSFESENEIRLVTNPFVDTNPKYSRLELENTGDRVRRFLKVEMRKLCADDNIEFEDLFDKIIIGPRSEQSVYELKEYVLSLGYNNLHNVICMSECPLR